MVLTVCCLLRLQEAQLYRSVFLSVAEVCIDLSWKTPPLLYSCNGDKDRTLQLLNQALFCISSADDYPPVARTGMDMRVQPGEPVMLTGTESTDDQGIVSYEWKQVFGNPSVEMKVGSCRKETSRSVSTVVCTRLGCQSYWLIGHLDFPFLSQLTNDPVPKSYGTLLVVASTLSHATGTWRFLASSGLRFLAPGRHLKSSWVRADLPGREHPRVKQLRCKSCLYSQTLIVQLEACPSFCSASLCFSSSGSE